MNTPPASSQGLYSQLKENEQKEINLIGLLNSIWRAKIWIALCGFLAFGAGFYYAYFVVTPTYTASTTVVLDSTQAQLTNLDSVVAQVTASAGSLSTEIEVLRSRGLLGKLVDRLDLTKDPEFNPHLREKPSYSYAAFRTALRNLILGPRPAVDVSAIPPERLRETAVNIVRGKIRVSTIGRSYVLRITSTSTNPLTAAKLTNALAELYILEQIEVKFNATEQATTWLTERVGELKIDLENAEEQVKEFNANSTLINENTLVLLNQQIKELRDRKISEQATIDTALARIAALRTAFDAQNFEQLENLAGDRSLSRLLALRAEGALTDEAALIARFEQIIDRTQLEADRAAAQLPTLTASIETLENQIASQSDDLVTLQQLQREAEASRVLYEYFLTRLKEASIQQGIQQADSRILSQSTIPGGPAAPNKNLIIILALLSGVVFGAVTALAWELSHNTFRTADDLELITGYTVLGQIPAIPANKRSNVLKYLVEKPTSAAAEAIRNLRTSTLLADLDEPPQIIMSTSSIPGEGKTTQSISLAQNLSGLGKKVLLIEGDIRRRVFSQYFDIANKKGLLSVLSKETTLEDAVVRVDQLSADILIGEQSKTNAADVFSSQAFLDFIADLRTQYDYIIIDTPPVLVVPDARVIGQAVDSILYTVKWDSTTKRQVIEGLKSFENVNLKVSGLVLGQINARRMARYGYGDSYGSYSKYGRGYYDN